MDFRDHLDRLRGSLWLIVLVGVVVGAIGYMVTPRQYEAHVLISVGGYMQSPDPDRVDVSTAIELAQAYAIVAKTRGVLNTAADAVDVPLSLTQLQGIVETRVVPDTAILEVSVHYSDPVLATDLAYAIAEEIIYVSPTDQRLGASARRGLPSNYLSIIEGARPVPVGPSPADVGMMSALMGAVLVYGGILLKDYLSDTIRSADEVNGVLGLPVLGSIPKFPRMRGHTQEELRIDLNGDFVSERYRALRTGFLHSFGQQEKQPYIVTSAGSGEGKSVTAANLAAATSMTDLNVLLIDADFRHPSIHELFGLSNDKGFTTLLAAEPPTLNGGCELLNIADIVAEVVLETDIPGLRVITSGRYTPESPALLASSNTQRWMKALQSAMDVDVILIDTPPALVMSDAFDLGARTDASIILVLEAKKTTHAAALEIKRQCEYLNLRLHGAILNRVDPGVHARYYKRARLASKEDAAMAADKPTVIPAKILVVEDDPSLARLMSTQLSKIGYKTEVTDKGQHALELARRWKPDLVILDVMLADDVDGFEVSQRIRQARKLATVPIIMVTAYVDYDARVTGFETGADDYITKPFDMNDLALRVAALLRRTQASSGGQWPSQQMGQPLPTPDEANGNSDNLAQATNDGRGISRKPRLRNWR